MFSAPYLDDVVIGWQEKLFRATELRYYSGKREEDFANDVLRKKFYHDAKVHFDIAKRSHIVEFKPKLKQTRGDSPHCPAATNG